MLSNYTYPGSNERVSSESCPLAAGARLETRCINDHRSSRGLMDKVPSPNGEVASSSLASGTCVQLYAHI